MGFIAANDMLCWVMIFDGGSWLMMMVNQTTAIKRNMGFDLGADWTWQITSGSTISLDVRLWGKLLFDNTRSQPTTVNN